ncbi:MAG: SiaC family regulatory phosphoprotein [Bacteroidales bacterium]|jgi:hypothetical protein|nr:SiaC family regulatory phosphoprotein [Bacteroidales bacterium]
MALNLFKKNQKQESGIYNLILNKTHNVPEVKFNLNGTLELNGRLIPEDAASFFEVLIDWIKELKAEKVEFHSRLEYINTTSSQNLLFMLKELENNPSVKEIIVHWYFESDDPESEELGILLATNLNKCVFRYIDCEDLDELVL